jgi:uncharacterized CHY-type Zn-finger protein
MKKSMYSQDHDFWEVYCNGKLLDYCMAADEEGWARCYKIGDNNELILEIDPYDNRPYPIETIINGKIEFRLKWKEYLEMIKCHYCHV